MAQKHLVNKGLGILGKCDDIELWTKIVTSRRIRRFISSNKCKKILVIAGGLGAEVDVFIVLNPKLFLELFISMVSKSKLSRSKSILVAII